MKVISFTVGLAIGIDAVFEALDRFVAELGEIEIHSIKDTVYSGELNRHIQRSLDPDERIVRVVVYTPLQSGVKTSFPAI